MGLDESLFGFCEYRKILQEIDNFLGKHLPGKFTSIFPLRLINSTKWKFDYLISKKIVKNDFSKSIDLGSRQYIHSEIYA